MLSLFAKAHTLSYLENQNSIIRTILTLILELKRKVKIDKNDLMIKFEKAKMVQEAVAGNIQEFYCHNQKKLTIDLNK